VERGAHLGAAVAREERLDVHAHPARLRAPEEMEPEEVVRIGGEPGEQAAVEPARARHERRRAPTGAEIEERAREVRRPFRRRQIAVVLEDQMAGEARRRAAREPERRRDAALASLEPGKPLAGARRAERHETLQRFRGRRRAAPGGQVRAFDLRQQRPPRQGQRARPERLGRAQRRARPRRRQATLHRPDAGEEPL
jgi:hypothetical protein